MIFWLDLEERTASRTAGASSSSRTTQPWNCSIPSRLAKSSAKGTASTPHCAKALVSVSVVDASSRTSATLGTALERGRGIGAELMIYVPLMIVTSGQPDKVTRVTLDIYLRHRRSLRLRSRIHYIRHLVRFLDPV